MPYIAFLHTHNLLVILYVLLFVIKFVLMLAAKPETFERFRRRTRIAEMVLPTLFILTGIVLAIQSQAYNHSWFWFKMGVMVFATLNAVMTFVRRSVPLGVITLFAFTYLFVVSYMKRPDLQDGRVKDIAEEKQFNTMLAGYSRVEHGKYIYTEKLNCSNCHGQDGTLGLAGAGDLRQSQLTTDGIKEVILHGRKNMPAYRDFITETEVEALTDYVKSLRVQ